MEAKLRECENIDLDWTLMTPKIHRACSLIGKGLKQKPTTVLLGILVLISFCLGHSSIIVDGDWVEPIIIWIAAAIPTGRCKSAFHQWLQEVIDEVEKDLKRNLRPVKPMVLTNCTWERFGERMAESGGRQLGLFDEITSFFSTMNMYSSQKMQVSDTKEYQDFLQMFTGKTKSRETITGNANFHMTQTSFTMMGFTQPFAALPIIKDLQNCVKGFTSRILWLFPKPVFCTMAERRLTQEERVCVNEFRKLLVEFLTNLYELGESTYTLSEENKVKNVRVKRREFVISPDAQQSFDSLHDEWESVCEQHPQDPLIGGLYSRGKAQVLRLAVPIQLMLEMTNEGSPAGNKELQEATNQPHMGKRKNDADDNEDTPMNGAHDMQEDGVSELGDSQISHPDPEDNDIDDEDEPVLTDLQFRQRPIHNVVGVLALKIARSIAESSIHQQCILNDKIFADPDTRREQHILNTPLDPMKALYKSILLTDTKIVSFTLLSLRGLFRKPINGQNGKALLRLVAQSIGELGLGNTESFVSSGNNTSVYFFMKSQPPSIENVELCMAFSEKLVPLGISLPSYRQSFQEDGPIFDKHNEEYEIRKNAQTISTASPSKRQKQK